MRRLRSIDIVLLAFLAPLWMLCFSLYIHRIFYGRLAWVPVFVSAPESANDYPTVRGFWLGSEAEKAGLAVGDRLTRVGEADLRSVGPFGFVARAYDAATPDLQIGVDFLREGNQGTISLGLRRAGFPWRMLPLSLGFAVVAVFILLRAPSTRLARAFFLASITYSLYWTFFFGGPRLQTYLWAVVFFCSALLMFPFMLRAVLLFPEEVAPVGRLPLWPWLFVIYGPIMTSMAFGVPLPHATGLHANFAMTAVFIVTLLVLLVRNFRRAGPLGRRQLKWVVYGIYLGAVPVLIADMITTLNPALVHIHEIATLSLAFVPLCIFVAIVRFNLLDVDRLISTTATHTILLVFLLAGVLTVVPRLSQAASAAVGLAPLSGQIVLSFLLAMVMFPGQRYLRPQVERLFFKQRYTLERGVKQLLDDVSICIGAREMLTMLSDRLDILLQPESCTLYERAGEAYVPAVVRGSVVPPVFPVHSPLVEALQARVAPLEAEQWRRAVRVHLDPADRSILENFRIAVLLPVNQDESLKAFVCLGYKQSGDVYTATDLALLASIVDRVREQLLRFGNSERDAVLLQGC